MKKNKISSRLEKKTIGDFTLREIGQICRQHIEHEGCRECEFLEFGCDRLYPCQFKAATMIPANWKFICSGQIEADEKLGEDINKNYKVPRKLEDGKLAKDLTLEELSKMCSNISCEDCAFYDKPNRSCRFNTLSPNWPTRWDASGANIMYTKVD